MTDYLKQAIELAQAQASVRVMTEDEIIIAIELKTGDSAATAWGCDLTYDYVKINGDYRT